MGQKAPKGHRASQMVILPMALHHLWRVREFAVWNGMRKGVSGLPLASRPNLLEAIMFMKLD
jgi:hypothetical protein